MREIGSIKWFGGYDRINDRQMNYGFISREGHEDLYIHQRQVRCDSTLLTPRVAVSFIVEVGRNGRPEALDLILLAQEVDPDVLERAARSADLRTWQAALQSCRDRGEIQQAVMFFQDRLPQLAPLAWKKLLTELPDSLLRREHAWRAALSLADQVRVLCDWLRDEPQILQQPTIRVEISALARSVDVSTRNRLADLIPRAVAATSQALRAVLPIQEHVLLVLDLFDRLVEEKGDQHEAIVLELASRANEFTPELWNQIPALLTIQDELWDAASAIQRHHNLFRVWDTRDGLTQPLTLIRVCQVLKVTPARERAAFIAPIRTTVLQEREIISLLYPGDQATALAEILQTSDGA